MTTRREFIKEQAPNLRDKWGESVDMTVHDIIAEAIELGMANAHLKDPDVYDMGGDLYSKHVYRNQNLLAKLFTYGAKDLSEEEAQHIAEYIVKYLQGEV